MLEVIAVGVGTAAREEPGMEGRILDKLQGLGEESKGSSE